MSVLAGVVALVLTPSVAGAGAGDVDERFGADGSGFAFPALPGAERRVPGTPVAVFPLPGGGTEVVGHSTTNVDDATRTALTVTHLTADGALDTTYGNGTGVVRHYVDATGPGGAVTDAIRLDDGDLMVLGHSYEAGDGGSGYALVRLDPDGSLDTSFGDGDGKATGNHSDYAPPPGPGYNYGASASSLVQQGENVVVRAEHFQSIQTQWGPTYSSQLNLARHTLADGQLDLTFGPNGSGLAPAPAPSERHSVAYLGHGDLELADAQGRLVLTNDVEAPNSDDPMDGFSRRVAAWRFDPDGQLDETFGDGGVRVVPIRVDGPTSFYEQPTGLRQLSTNSEIAITGISSYRYGGGPEQAFVARLDSVGDPVGAFGTGGVVVAGDGEHRYRFEDVLEHAGQLYVAGTAQHLLEDGLTWTSSASMVARFTSTGPDASFGDGGYADATGRTGWHYATTGRVDEDGHVLVFGEDNADRGMTVAAFDLLAARTPVNETAPSVTGDPDIGSQLAAGQGSWFYEPTGFAYRWQRCTTAEATSCTDIEGATASQHTVTGDDAGSHLRALVTASNSAGSAAVATPAVAVLATPVSFVFGPTLNPPASQTQVGSTLQLDRGTDQGSPPITRELRWERCDTSNPPEDAACVEVDTADGTADDEYVTVAADAGKFVRGIVTSTGPVNSVTRKTATRPIVAATAGSATPAATTPPGITPGGSVEEGATLTSTGDGTWNQGGLAFARRWERCNAADSGCAAIDGATGTSYATTAADAGKHVRLRVTATNAASQSGSAFSPTTAVTGKPKTPVPPPPAPQPEPPAQPQGIPGVVVTDTTATKVMPDVRGLQVDEAKKRILETAGIPAAITSVETTRKEPASLKGKQLDMGDVSAQSVAPGTPVTGSIAQPVPIRLVTEIGPRAKPSTESSVCQGRDFRNDLPKLSIEDVMEILQAKRCKKLDFDFVVSKSAQQMEVRKAEKEDKRLELTIVAPADPAKLDLTVAIRQGAFNGQASFGDADWALTAGAENVFGVQVLNRAGLTVAGADVLVDGSNVDAPDVRSPSSQSGIWYRGGFKPKKAGLVNVLVQQSDAEGNRVSGFAQVRVVERKGSFKAIDGSTFSAGGSKLRSAPVASAAAAQRREGWFADLLRSVGLGALADVGLPQEGTISTAAKQQAGQIQLMLGQPSNGLAGVIASGSANVVASGSANVVAAGGANVVAAGSANVVAAGSANRGASPRSARLRTSLLDSLIAIFTGRVITAGQGNKVSAAKGTKVADGAGATIGDSLIKNGTGNLRELSIGGAVIAAGSANVVAAGGGNVIAAGSANVVSAGSAN